MRSLTIRHVLKVRLTAPAAWLPHTNLRLGPGGGQAWGPTAAWGLRMGTRCESMLPPLLPLLAHCPGIHWDPPHATSTSTPAGDPGHRRRPVHSGRVRAGDGE